MSRKVAIFTNNKSKMKATIYWKTQDGRVIEILKNHVKTGSGNFNGVCVSAVLSYFGIPPNAYKYTWSQRSGNDCAYSILRRFGYGVRSRASFFKGCTTVGLIRKKIASTPRKKRPIGSYYLVSVDQHILLLDVDGNTVCDTSPRKRDRRKVLEIKAVVLPLKTSKL